MATRFPGLVSGRRAQPPHSAVVLPVTPVRDGVPAALLVLGVNSPARRRLPAVLRPHRRADVGHPDEVKMTALNRRGREVVIRVVCSSLRGNGGEPGGAVLVVERQND
ncbi:hypothetical protein PV646_16640 [Streptomyces sp. ID05-26A]|nr:hypothetical protein [Streptomyces sp. ID05-26A]